jgi:hypothetical protein
MVEVDPWPMICDLVQRIHWMLSYTFPTCRPIHRDCIRVSRGISSVSPDWSMEMEMLEHCVRFNTVFLLIRRTIFLTRDWEGKWPEARVKTAVITRQREDVEEANICIMFDARSERLTDMSLSVETPLSMPGSSARPFSTSDVSCSSSASSPGQYPPSHNQARMIDDSCLDGVRILPGPLTPPYFRRKP